VQRSASSGSAVSVAASSGSRVRSESSISPVADLRGDEERRVLDVEPAANEPS
jgi:hypothetical protein